MRTTTHLILIASLAAAPVACDNKKDAASDTKSADKKAGDKKAGDEKAGDKKAGDAKAADDTQEISLSVTGLKARAPKGAQVSSKGKKDIVMIGSEKVTVEAISGEGLTLEGLKTMLKEVGVADQDILTKEESADGFAYLFKADGKYNVLVMNKVGDAKIGCGTGFKGMSDKAVADQALALCKSLKK